MQKKSDGIKFKTPDDVVAYVREQLVAAGKQRGELSRLAKISGVNMYTMRLMMQGITKEPSYQKLTTLLPYLGVKTQYKPGRHFMKYEA